MLLNAEFSLENARHLAGRLWRESEDTPRARLRRAFELTLSRPPSKNELAQCLGFLGEQAARLRSENRTGDWALPIPAPKGVEPAQAAAVTDLCLALFNLNAFVYVD